MNRDETARKQVLADWQKKHGVADDDPLFAAVELFEIYAASLRSNQSEKPENPPSFSEFRDTLEKLDQISKNLTHVAQDLTREIRKTLPEKPDRGGFGVAILLLLVALLFGSVYIIWNFIL